MKRKVIFDCDPGLDDALALLLALASDELDVIAVTTIAGNSTIENTTQNALNLLEFYGKETIPVAKGSSNPILGRFNSGSHVHGSTGIGGVELPKAKSQCDSRRAHELIAQEILKSEEKVTIIATGPLTNVGMAISLYPEILDNIEMISLMGGSVNVGNVSAVAEANCKNDPEAAHIVFNSGARIAMFGLNVTYQTTIKPSEMEEIRNIGGKYAQAAADFLTYHFESYKVLPYFDGDPSHDSCAVAYLLKPEIFKMEELNVVVDLSGHYSRGQTIIDLHKVTGRKENALVALSSNREMFVQLLKDSIIKLSSR
ncbi:MAG TPA: nucleoside hydrolase [Erysipelotrichaceae bacterium]|nr:nucleoside hydrolase [Erysipelotrichaceae bacterium]